MAEGLVNKGWKIVVDGVCGTYDALPGGPLLALGALVVRSNRALGEDHDPHRLARLDRQPGEPLEMDRQWTLVNRPRPRKRNGREPISIGEVRDKR